MRIVEVGHGVRRDRAGAAEQVGEAFDVRARAGRRTGSVAPVTSSSERRKSGKIGSSTATSSPRLDDRLECEREAVEAATCDHDALGREALARGDPLPQQRDALGPGVLQRGHPRLGEHAGDGVRQLARRQRAGSGTPDSRRIASGWRGRRTAAPNPIGALSSATSAVRRGAAASLLDAVDIGASSCEVSPALRPFFTVMSADSTVSPGPNAMAATRSPSAAEAWSRMYRSTNNSTVALDMLPKSRSVERGHELGLAELQARLDLVEDAAPARMDGPVRDAPARGIRRQRVGEVGVGCEQGLERAGDVVVDDRGHRVGEHHPKPWSPIFHAMSPSPTGVMRVSNRSSANARPPPSGRAVTIPAPAPSANSDDATIVSGSFDERRCSVQSSTLTTSTTASGSASQNCTALRSAGIDA